MLYIAPKGMDIYKTKNNNDFTCGCYSYLFGMRR